jgi:hypothetical protein
MFGFFFAGDLYLRLVLGHGALEMGLAFPPARHGGRRSVPVLRRRPVAIGHVALPRAKSSRMV